MLGDFESCCKQGSAEPRAGATSAARAGALTEPSVLAYFYCYSHWDNEIIGIFFFLMRMRRNTLVSKWFSHRGKPLVSTWLLSNGGKLEHYTDISCDGPYFSCLFGVKWDGRNICLKRVILCKLCREENRSLSRAGGGRGAGEAKGEGKMARGSDGHSKKGLGWMVAFSWRRNKI